ncbi:hypothetical protein [Paraburkholderia sp.]|uniref:hypothetical protein n=1 Tax=Paraburkholderia sp. TaxID=1926495 RepID=UPI0039E704D0
MGEFAESVRRGEIKGPSRSGFRRDEWIKRKGTATLDDTDTRILEAGIFLDDLLSSVRKRIRLADIDLQPSVLVRLIIGLSTYNLFLIHENAHIIWDDIRISRQLKSTSLLQNTVEVADGQTFTPDEVITGCGDGMKHMFRQLIDTRYKQGLRDESNIINEDLIAINEEISNAVLYQSAVEIWNDCLGNEYGLEFHGDSVEVRPSRPNLEIDRVVSMYRRENIALRTSLDFAEIWNFRWSRKEKEVHCEIPLVVKIHGDQRIERIDLGTNEKTLNAAALGIVSMLWLRHGYYQSFLDEPLPQLMQFTLNQMIMCWRFLQSLAIAILTSVKAGATANPTDLLRFSPKISERLLCRTLAKTLSMDSERARQLINTFVFSGDNSQDLWLQPLMRVGEDFCLIVPCIHSAKLERIVEGWMRQGGLELKRRGPEFEKYCRSELTIHAAKSPISSAIKVIGHEVKFTGANGKEERIDIVAIVGGTILLIEAKCILWPDDSLRLTSYRDTIREATIQITRQKDAVLSDYAGFSRRLLEFGHEISNEANVVCCVVTNSAVYAGSAINGVPVVDLPMLARYFDNRYIKIETRAKGESISQHTIRFYDDEKQAGLNLRSYLSAPPQLIDMKEYVKARDVSFPMDSQPSGRLVYRTYSVDIDIEAMTQKYELTR